MRFNKLNPIRRCLKKFVQSTPFLPTLLLQKFIELYVKYEAFIYQHWRFDVRIAPKIESGVAN